jgi:hypothetical protein
MSQLLTRGSCSARNRERGRDRGWLAAAPVVVIVVITVVVIVVLGCSAYTHWLSMLSKFNPNS